MSPNSAARSATAAKSSASASWTVTFSVTCSIGWLSSVVRSLTTMVNGTTPVVTGSAREAYWNGFQVGSTVSPGWRTFGRSPGGKHDQDSAWLHPYETIQLTRLAGERLVDRSVGRHARCLSMGEVTADTAALSMSKPVAYIPTCTAGSGGGASERCSVVTGWHADPVANPRRSTSSTSAVRVATLVIGSRAAAGGAGDRGGARAGSRRGRRPWRSTRCPRPQLDPGRLAELTSPSLFSTKRAVVLDDLAELPSDLVGQVVELAQRVDADLALVLVHNGAARNKKLVDAVKAPRPSSSSARR